MTTNDNASTRTNNPQSNHPLLTPGSILSLWGEAVDRLTEANNGDLALLYLYILRTRTLHYPHWDKAKNQQVRDTLVAMGLLSQAQVNQLMPPPAPVNIVPIPQAHYTKDDLNSCLADKKGDFSDLANQVELKLGKKLNQNDLEHLLRLYDDAAMPSSLILLLVQWCITEQERKYGVSRRPSLSMISKVGNQWIEKGIATLESAEQYIQRMGDYQKNESKISRALGIYNRELIQKEKDWVAQWVGWGFGPEAIGHAYEKTVYMKNTLNWNYCNGILQRWHDAGLHSLEQIKSSDQVMGPRPVRQDRAPGRKVSKGPSAHDTMEGTAQTPPSPEQSQQVLADREELRRLLEEI